MFVFNILGSAAVNNEAKHLFFFFLKMSNIKVHKCFNVKFKRLSLSLSLSSLCLSPIQEEERQITPGPSTGAVIGGILGALVVIGIIVGIVYFIRKRQEDGE